MQRGTKEAIIELLLEQREWHPTAKELYRHLKNRMSGLAFSSVYRALENLIKDEKIRRFTINGEKEQRFEIYDKPHPHFKCINCGKIYNIELEINFTFKEFIEAYTDHIVIDINITYFGICRDCLSKKVEEFVEKYHV